MGRAVAVRLGRAGAAAAAAARTRREIDDVAAEIAAAGGRSVAVEADVTDERAVSSLVAEVGRTLGPATLLVNNAGSWAQVGPVAESDPATWWRDVEVSLRGTYLCTRAVLPAMLAAGRGRIVNVSSYAAIKPAPYQSAYGSAKAAVLRFTDSLSAELAGTGVLVFAVTPGFVRTRMVEQVAHSTQGRRFLPQLEQRQDALEPELAAGLVAEIASGRLDPLAGCLLHVLDDVDELLARADEIAEHGLHTLRLQTPPY